MELTRTERLILSNQYKILEALYPKERESYEEAREAVESGYELHYRWLAEHIADGNQIMSEDECGFVLDVLSMHEALKRSYEGISDKDGIEEWRVIFTGFDGNNEAKYLNYAEYFCGLDGGRFTDLRRKEGFNSHCPTLSRYRGMLSQWEQLRKKPDLSREEVLQIVNR